MKFNVLVVAAMVITSVSAGRKGKSNKPVKKSGGDSMSAPSYNPLEAGEGTSQESDPNETGPASYSGDDGADKTQPVIQLWLTLWENQPRLQIRLLLTQSQLVMISSPNYILYGAGFGVLIIGFRVCFRTFTN
ncbi:hypothetical protein BASA81_014359 [Batrachochytrium salamandrivorans]|nr:hypothetical protein BASA81_014359 [Batrachochytrium salamandrivorans]